MKLFALIVALSVAAAAPAHATEYGSRAAAACKVMRNENVAAPRPRAPNQDDIHEVVSRAGGVKSPLDSLPENRKKFAQAFPILKQIDSDGTAQLSKLPPSTPHIDAVIDKHLFNLMWARGMLGIFYEEGRAPAVDFAKAAELFQRSIDTQFLDDRGCLHTLVPDYDMVLHLAGFYYYGQGVAPGCAW